MTALEISNLRLSRTECREQKKVTITAASFLSGNFHAEGFVRFSVLCVCASSAATIRVCALC
jgi:hypothetical protein